MRTLGWGVALLVSIGGIASADVFRWHGKGAGAAVALYSNDGCVETSGELVFASTSAGTFALTIIQRTDWCAEEPVTSFFAGGGDASFSSSGLSSATASGSIVATDYTPANAGSITIDFNLAFTGSGGVSATTSHFASGGGGATISFNSQRHRGATVTGGVAIDGDGVTASDGQLFTETAGEIVIVP